MPEDRNGYICSGCGASSVKLWREYSTFRIVLKCRVCSEREQDRNLDNSRNFEIGWRVPAVPDGDGNYWGYSSIPKDRFDWWRALPDGDSLEERMKKHLGL